MSKKDSKQKENPKPEDIPDPPDREKSEWTEEGNHAYIINASPDIRTEEDMLRATQADLSKWKKVKWSSRVWKQGSKLKVHGEWALVKTNLWYSRMDFLPVEPVAIQPVVQPMKIRISRRGGKGGKGRSFAGLSTAVILPDPQFGFKKDHRTGELTPFHDRAALDVAVQIVARERPEKIIWLGDMLDLAEWSDKFIRSPEFYWSTQPAVVEAAWWLGQMYKACPPAQQYVLEGNHDKRLEDALITHLRTAYMLRPADEMEKPAMLSVPRLLALDDLGVEYVGDYPNGEVWLNDALVCVHGNTARAAPGATTGNRVRNIDVTEIHGHIHRREWATRTLHGRHGRRVIEAFCPGCLCRIDGVVPGKKAKQNWQQGVAIVRFDSRQRYSISPVSIFEGEALSGGVIYRARDPLPALRKDTDWEF